MSDKRSVAVRIRGREFRIRSDEDSEALQRIARHVDETMLRVEQRTGTVDSQDVALLTALNLAREVVKARDLNTARGVDPERLRTLIELAESALATEAG
jgi:cell division protein ZapA (FtsZ GTPase activity inhibitor)